jgi:hypothetical protein
MAILSLDTLSGCNSIPGFISGAADAGVTSRMIFQQTSAPTSWTKDTTTHNNKSLRIVNTTTLTPGGTQPFTAIFTSRAVAGTVAQQVTGVTVQGNSAGVTITAAQSGITVQGHTLTTAQIPAHTHVYNISLRPSPRRSGPLTTADFPAPSLSFDARGGSGSHTHPISEGNHNHPITNPAHPHGRTDPQHNHVFVGTAQDFAVTYVDVIIASKN